MTTRARQLLTLSCVVAGLLAVVPGATASPVSRIRIGGPHPTRATALPITTAAPAWFTPALQRRVIRAGARGVPLSKIRMPSAHTQHNQIAASSPCLYQTGAGPTGGTVPTTPQGLERPPVGLGPGTWLITLFCDPVGGQQVPDGFAWCTANFVFHSSTTMGLGTAGHCAAKDALGTPVTAIVTPPPEVCANGGSCAPGLYAIGTFAKAVNGGLGNDFALISLYPKFNSWVRSAMPIFGGPTGEYLGGLAGTQQSSVSGGGVTVNLPGWSPAVVGHCGHGLVVGTGGTCRTSAGLFSASTWYAWYGASMEGDSGSGVEILGNYAGGAANAVPAAADLTHIIISDASISPKGQISEGPDQPGMIGGTQMSRIQSILGSSWQLVPGGLP